MIKKIISLIVIVILITGCGGENEETVTPSTTTTTGEDYILSLVNCEDAYISRGFDGYDGHKGVDIAAPEGTHIYAAADGVVDKVVIMNMGYGNHIIIDHGDYKTLYAHCQAFTGFKEAGDRVEKGKIIGYVGNTGNSTGPHLHFEVITDTQQNPVTWFE